MATRAHSTRTPLLPPAATLPPLLGSGFGKQPGPVTLAIRAMREADPEMPRIVELRRAIGDRIEADIALLDALMGDCDLEDGGDDEPSLGSTDGLLGWSRVGLTDDREQDAGDEPEEENEHGGDIQDEPHDPQVDDVLPSRRRFEPLLADGLRVIRQQVEALRLRRSREARA